MTSRVVIGVANGLRGDDAAGFLVVERLDAVKGRNFDLLHSSGDVGQLLDWFQIYDDVVVVDAIQSGSNVLRLDARIDRLPSTLSGASSHLLGLADAVELARTLGKLPPRLIVYGVPGQQFSHGESISPVTAQAVKQVAALIRGEYLAAS